jgi:hypothetical protein
MKSIDTPAFRLILLEVAKKCEELGIDGVFAVSENVGPWWNNVIHFSQVRRIEFLDDASDGNKYNLLAIVFAKIAFVISHRKESEGKVLYEGEVPYRGAIISENRNFVYAFAGGTEDQDVEIARMAKDFHKIVST